VSQREDRHRRPSRRDRVGLLEGGLTASSATPVGATGGRRLRLRPSIEPLNVGDELYLIRPGAEDLVIRDARNEDRALVAALEREALTADDLATRLGLSLAAVNAKLDALAAAGVLTPGASSAPLEHEDAERFSRQQAYLAEFGDERDLQRRLAAARVTVVGCGGLGSWVLAALAAAGVRRLRLVDDDKVELSNLNRQAIYRADQLGIAKVEAAAQWLWAFDPRIEADVEERRVDGLASARLVARDADVLVLMADEPPYMLARWFNAACLEAGVPFITAGQIPPLVRVGPLYVPTRTACFACHEAAIRADSIAYDRYVERARESPSRAATLGPASALAGSLVALEVMHLLLGVEPATAGAALTIDIRTLRVSRDVVGRDDACEACAAQR
jgi:molybdopterin-synthase adenylyltransferase